MKTSEEIIECVKNNENTDGFEMLELHLYLCINQILNMFSNGYLDKEQSNKYKNLAVKQYENNKKQYEFEKAMFQEHIEHIKNTEMLRIELRKMLNDEETPITEERLAATLNVALGIISIIFKEEF